MHCCVTALQCTVVAAAVVTHLACPLLVVLWLLLLVELCLRMAQTATAYEPPCWKHLQQQKGGRDIGAATRCQGSANMGPDLYDVVMMYEDREQLKHVEARCVPLVPAGGTTRIVG